MKLIIDIPEKVVTAIQNGEDYRYDIHTAIASGTPYSPTDKNDCEGCEGCVHYNYDGDIPYCELGYSIEERCKEFRRSLPATIEYYEEKARELKEEATTMLAYDEDIDPDCYKERCLKCAREYEQLAQWLKELRELRIRRPVCSFDEYVVYKKIKGIVEY